MDGVARFCSIPEITGEKSTMWSSLRCDLCREKPVKYFPPHTPVTDIDNLISVSCDAMQTSCKLT